MKVKQLLSPQTASGGGGGQHNRWLGLLMLLVLLLGSSQSMFAVDDFVYAQESKVHGSSIYTRWSNWVGQHYVRNNNNYTFSNVVRYGNENSYRGWNYKATEGRPSTWYYSNKCGPTINNGTWFGERTFLIGSISCTKISTK